MALFLLGPSDQRRDVRWPLGLKSVADVEDGVAGVTNRIQHCVLKWNNKKQLLTFDRERYDGLHCTLCWSV